MCPDGAQRPDQGHCRGLPRYVLRRPPTELYPLCRRLLPLLAGERPPGVDQ